MLLIIQFRLTGRKPVGYRAPWWEMNLGSPALLARHGFRYDSSLMDDERPYILPTDGGDIGNITNDALPALKTSL